MANYIERIGEKQKSSVTGEVYYTYIPRPLPPKPALEMDRIYSLLDQANVAMGRLDGLSVI